MRFVDCVSLHLTAGHGGAGCIAYRKEKFVARGGPYGGNGGRGGDVVMEASRNIGTLLDLRYRKIVKAEDGHRGMSKRQHGSWGENTIIKVPVGTIVREARTRTILGDLSNDGDTVVIARGGRGGLGNAEFKTAVRQTPHFAQPGEPGLEFDVILELKLLADIGIIGYPSVGKSTLISVISNARPKIASYHFTTLIPNLGIVKYKNYRSFVVADIPGLIEGAHEGKGLGYRFLRHIERCRALAHLIEVPLPSGYEYDGSGDADMPMPSRLEALQTRDPIHDFDAICNELALFSESLAQRPQLVVLGKMDQPHVREREPELRAHFEGLGYKFFAVSSATRDGLEELVDAMMELVDRTEVPNIAHFTVPEAEELSSADTTPMDWEGSGTVGESVTDAEGLLEPAVAKAHEAGDDEEDNDEYADEEEE